MNAALDRFIVVDAQQGELVKRRFCVRSIFDEAAAGQGISEPAAKRRGACARAWFFKKAAERRGPCGSFSPQF